ncbi:MAG: DUF11 domain-containing protein [Planctomycetales bacterium]|nr:DUF11 domain-containing protein [Planctomycetales bacterium]
MTSPWMRLRSKFSHTPSKRKTVRLKLETLEHRRVLAAAGTQFPAITGTIFQDFNQDDVPSAGEEVENAVVRLFADDGDGIFEPGGDDLQFGADETTDANGVYCFDNLDGSTTYFVQQIAQTVNGVVLEEQVDSVSPGTPGITIDRFETTQIGAEASPPVGTSGSSTVQTAPPPDEIIGLERDIVVILDAGAGSVDATVNEFGTTNSLRFNADVDVFGRATLTWDGTDNDAAGLAFGLSGTDLTDGGLNTGIMLRIGARDTGSTARVRLYKTNSSTFSESSFGIPQSATGVAEFYQFLPFTGFAGSVNANDVDAIELLIDSDAAAANNVEVDVIGANGPKQLNFDNTPNVDLEITKTDNLATAVPGQQLTYTITATNNGPVDVTGATVTDTFPVEFENVTYTSVATGTVSGHTTSGTGNINDTVNLAVDSNIVYTAIGTVSPSATGSLTNDATIAVPNGFVDSVPENNTAQDVDTLEPQSDLEISKTDNIASVTPGDAVTYTIMVTNNGLSDVNGAVIEDALPAELTNVTYTSTVTGAVTGNTSSGSGDINDTVNMPANSAITYTVVGTVASSATGTLSNTVTVTAPSGVVELNLLNNSSTDQDTITPTFDLEISKTDNRTTVGPNDVVAYTIVVQNNGPSDVTNATITDDFPAALTNVSYTSTTSGTVSGQTASGSGNINDVVSLTSGSSITYTATATVAASASGTIVNTATVTPSNLADESNQSNNSATDTDTVTPDFDLSITKTNSVTSVTSGQATSYTIVVANSGPSDVDGATVVDAFPTELTNVSYTSVASSGASGNTSGTGSISDTVNLPSGSSITYTVSGTVDANASGSIVNTATVTAPTSLTESNTTNNSATDTDTINRQLDLTISKTDNRTTLSPGESTTYTIVVSNEGPTDATGATVTDAFSSNFTSVTYTSSANGGASGNSAAGTGDINDTVNLPAGSSITYLATATLANSVSGNITNTATVTAPAGISESDFGNNVATDTDTIDIALRSISGSVYADLDNNGRRTGLEPPIEGVLVTLDGVDNTGAPVVQSTTTNAAGDYFFENLLPRTYTIRETQPFGFTDGQEAIGTGQTVDPTVTDDVFANLQLGSDDDAIDFDFGEIRPQGTKRRLLASSFS